MRAVGGEGGIASDDQVDLGGQVEAYHRHSVIRSFHARG